MWEGTTSKVVAADRPYGEFYDFYSVSSEYFGYIFVIPTFVTGVYFESQYKLVNKLCTEDIENSGVYS
jgi:hypothetical protein